MPAARKSPFTASAMGGRVLSALQLPLFELLPPAGYGVLTTRGRRSGKIRRRCVRAVRDGNRAYVVAIKGPGTSWATNARSDPHVGLRLREGRMRGVAREARDENEARAAAEAYAETVTRFDYLAYTLWRRGRPTHARVEELLRTWARTGALLIIELGGRRGSGTAPT